MATPPTGQDIFGTIVLLYVLALGTLVWLYLFTGCECCGRAAEVVAVTLPSGDALLELAVTVAVNLEMWEILWLAAAALAGALLALRAWRRSRG